MHLSSPILILTLALAATPTLTLPLQPRQPGPGTLTPQSILAVDPGTSSCTAAPYPDECRTASDAAPYVALSFTNFGITTFPAQAALLSLIIYETGSLKYSRNHYPAPGRSGQGTRNMQMPDYNLKYAEWLATACANCGVDAAQVAEAQGGGVDRVLQLVNGDIWGFASAAWFLRTQCPASVMEGLNAGTQAGWEQYLTGCVGTTATEERHAVWSQAIALGHW